MSSQVEYIHDNILTANVDKIKLGDHLTNHKFPLHGVDPPPQAPVLSLSVNQNNNPSLTWTDGMESDINGWRVKRIIENSSGTLTQYFNVSSRSFVDTDIDVDPKFGDTDAEYWVQTKDNNGSYSDLSNKKSIQGDGPLWKRPLVDSIETQPEDYVVHAPYPNPFNPSTKIRYELPAESNVSIRVFDLSGRMVRKDIVMSAPKGLHEYIWRGIDAQGWLVATGTYIFSIEALPVDKKEPRSLQSIQRATYIR